jgi:restriction system-associated AAA family ATPase
LTLNLYSVTDNQKRDLYQSNSLYFNETIPTLPSDQRVMRFKDVVLKKSGLKKGIYSKALSDGENQLLHTLGLCTLYRDTKTLFLLDEPETHFNPDWRAKFLTRINACFSGASLDFTREMLITTHAPFLISDSKPERVLVFAKSDDDSISISNPDYNTLGASINKITMSTFHKRETIGGIGQRILEEIKSRFEKGENRDFLIEEINRNLGESVEKVLLLKTILDSMPRVK